MGTSTAKLKLYKPAITGEAVDVALAINNNMDKLEALLPFTICTSGARPASPFQGQTIYETDTDLVYYYTGTVWRKWLIDSATGVVSTNTIVGSSATGNRNILHNGDFRVSQRGATGSASTATGISKSGMDRWCVYRAGFVTGCTWAQDTATTLANFRNGLKVLRTAADASLAVITAVQGIESFDALKLQSKFATLTYWARCGANFSSAGSILNASIISGTVADEDCVAAYTGSVTEGTVAQAITTSWIKYTLVTTAAMAAALLEARVQFSYTPVGSAGANDWFEITGVQLEEGAVATPFEQVPFAAEVARCQRYYVRYTGNSTAKIFSIGAAASATACRLVMPLPVQMRSVTPTVDIGTIGNLTPAGATACTAFSVAGADDKILYTSLTTTGLVAGQAVPVGWNVINSGSYLAVLAEL